MRNQEKYNTEIVQNILKQDNLIMIDEYFDVKTKVLCKDNEGYYVYILLDNYLQRHGIGRRYDKSNDKSIMNINHYLQKNSVPFICISDYYQSSRDVLKFQCNRCGDIVYMPWCNVNKNDYSNRSHILCENCDGRNESLHAIVLKQLFIHYYPDTVVEDKSYRNPLTGKICPTDIVNHKLKIAIEIQSQWHDFEDIKIKDQLKKEYWINAGYHFYSPDIRHYSILEMCQLFFDISTIPDWVNYEYAHKINVKQIQNMLNNNMSVHQIADELQINPHRIYDAIYTKKIYYPSNYQNINLIKPERRLQESQETAGCIR